MTPEDQQYVEQLRVQAEKTEQELAAIYKKLFFILKTNNDESVRYMGAAPSHAAIDYLKEVGIPVQLKELIRSLIDRGVNLNADGTKQPIERVGKGIKLSPDLLIDEQGMVSLKAWEDPSHTPSKRSQRSLREPSDF